MFGTKMCKRNQHAFIKLSASSLLKKFSTRNALGDKDNVVSLGSPCGPEAAVEGS